jgi:hypothetical protein
VVAQHRGVLKRARLAGDTPDTDIGGAGGAPTTDMLHTTPVASSMERAHGDTSGSQLLELTLGCSGQAAAGTEGQA